MEKLHGEESNEEIHNFAGSRCVNGCNALATYPTGCCKKCLDEL